MLISDSAFAIDCELKNTLGTCMYIGSAPMLSRDTIFDFQTSDEPALALRPLEAEGRAGSQLRVQNGNRMMCKQL